LAYTLSSVLFAKMNICDAYAYRFRGQKNLDP
jgi:hypothetical protein